jgi:predicted nucleic acid-binding protein/ADP-ribose pyrophosphatase YjhB (NUDIX family)
VGEVAPLPLAVNVAVLDGGRVLLTRREDFEVWCLPGGGVEHGESLAQAAVREVREETGLEVGLSRLVGLYSRPRFGGYHTLALFAASVAGGELRPDPAEVVELGWFGADELPSDLLWGQRERIEDALSGRVGSVWTTDTAWPEAWPRARSERYALRDRSGLGRAEFYRGFAAALGPEGSRIEVEGAESDQSERLEPGIAGEDCAISVVTVSELLHGVHRASGSLRNLRMAFVEHVLGLVDPVPITERVARAHARLWADLEERGTPLGGHDLWIAATALAHGFGVVTLDRRDFDRVDGLRVVAP